MQTYLNPFSAPGRWFRGNAHTHTTESDGLLTPQQAAAWYRERGYDWVAITDHRRCTDVEGLSSPGFLVLPGIEMHPAQNALGEPHHLVAAGVGPACNLSSEQTLQDAIDGLRASGAVAWLGHPYWLGTTWQEMIDLTGVIGIEVFNATCVYFGKGVSTVHWDDLLARGRLTWGLAVDDAHWGRADYGRGWVVVKAPELSQAAILQALAAGSFYASQGPEIYDVQVTPSEIYVRCSPVLTVTCVSLAGWGKQVEAPGPDQPLTEVTLPLRQQRVYVRIECTDAQGRTAWAPPVML